MAWKSSEHSRTRGCKKTGDTVERDSWHRTPWKGQVNAGLNEKPRGELLQEKVPSMWNTCYLGESKLGKRSQYPPTRSGEIQKNPSGITMNAEITSPKKRREASGKLVKQARKGRTMARKRLLKFVRFEKRELCHRGV